MREEILQVIQTYLLRVVFVKVAYICWSHEKEGITTTIAIETRNASYKQFQWLYFELVEGLKGREKFDVVHVNTLSDPQVKKRILQEGKLFVQRI
ncbi:hypothetical protein H9I32_02265 [Bacillus sp. Xin]|uniref:hypothetical protein n=1 Tax=unclassified Bacillus (in: firmicutes) TaxID=185979 RepID=UPI001574E93D|nr:MULTISPECIES: hypothetical protein [unclassified Bacillus (in: firmicutes)]MBC6971285.1 hypothetical protein [Bacillus sp. Xin]NSW35774.1 hypothetical protein [Bacillus sp. Xin1]